MAAMTLQQRVAACATGTAFTRTVIGALSKQAKYFLRNPPPPQSEYFEAEEWPAEFGRLATAVLNVPDGWALRFGVAVLTEPTYDAVEDADAILDEAVQGTVLELWPLFAVEFAQALQVP